MLSIIDRYFAREAFQTLVGVVAVLLLVFLSNRLVRYLAAAAAGQLPGDVIFTLVGLKIIKYLILLVPLGLYLAILLVLGRMYRDSEMAAMAACGVGATRLYRPVLLLAVPLALVQGWLSLRVVPWSDGLEDRIIAAAERRMDISAVTAGRFRKGREGNWVIYAEEVTGRSRLHNVFIHLRQRGEIVLLSAQAGRLQENPDSGGRYLVLSNGTRYDGAPGSTQFRILHFAKYGILLRPAAGAYVPELNAVPTAQLWTSSKREEAAELQWRMSVPVATLLLALLAVPVGKVNPRKGAYGKLFIAVLLYVFYFNLLALAQTWMEKGTVPLWLGLWWVHGLMLLVVLVMLVRQYGPKWVRETLTRRRFRAAIFGVGGRW